MSKVEIMNAIKGVIKDLSLNGFDRHQITEIMKHGVLFLSSPKDREVAREIIQSHKTTQKDITRFFNKDEEMINEAIDSAEIEFSEEIIEEYGVIIEEELPTEMKELGEKLNEVAKDEEVEEKEELSDEKEEIAEKEKLSPKGKMLIKKVEQLEIKIKEEKNPIKLHLLQFKLRMLLAKIQRELDLVNIKESYELKRKELKSKKDAFDNDNRKEIALLTEKIHLKKQEISSNSEYDYKSSDFGFLGIVKSEGELQELTKSLKADPETRSVAEDIEKTAKVRQELEELQKELKSKQQLVHDNNKAYIDTKKQLDFDEKRLTLINKYNIFSRIGDFFKNVKQSINDIRADIYEMKQLKNEYKKQKLEVKRKYEEEMASITLKSKQVERETLDKRKSTFLDSIKLKGQVLENANESTELKETAPVLPDVSQEETL